MLDLLSLCIADADRDGRLSIEDFIPLYKSIAAVRRAFRRQDHHCNGQIDRWVGAWHVRALAGVCALHCMHVCVLCVGGQLPGTWLAGLPCDGCKGEATLTGPHSCSALLEQALHCGDVPLSCAVMNA
jgi:hypothetical protein